MRILFLTCQPPHHMAPPSLGDEQINCGPCFLNQCIGDRWLSRTTPYGIFDIADLIKGLPSEQYPDVVVCHVDCGFGVKPRNLASLRCPVILLAADSHWGERALSEMVAYAASEPFSRVIVLYDRHHLELYRAAGIRNVHWFPALTFAHPDRRVQKALRQVREDRLALVGKVGYHFRRRRLFAALINAKLPLAWSEVRQEDAIAYYGASLIGINVVMNGDVNLRVFETIAGGAMLLTDKLSADAGLDHLLVEGREKVSYANEREFIERARHYLTHPAEAKAIGAAGQRWFTEHFNEQRRRAAFADIVYNGRDLPEFETISCRPTHFDFSSSGLTQEAALSGYDIINELHRQQEQVTIQMDRTVPEVIETMIATLPRTRVVRGVLPAGQPRSDLLVCGRDGLPSARSLTTSRVWVWNWPRETLAVLHNRLSPDGWLPAAPQSAVFQLRKAPIPSHQQQATEARRFLDAADQGNAAALAQQALSANRNCVEACLVMAELACDLKNAPLFEKMMLAAKRAEPNNPSIALLRWSAQHHPAPWQIARLMARAWKAYEAFSPELVEQYVSGVLAADPERAEPYYVRALSWGRNRPWGRHDRTNAERLDAEIDALKAAAEREPDRAAYWFALAVVQAEARLWEPAIAAFERVLQIDSGHALAWFGFGEMKLAAGQPTEAITAFTQSLELAPGSTLTKLARARAWRIAGDATKAGRELAEIRQAHPHDRGVIIESARLLLAQGDAMGALTEVQAILSYDEQSVEGCQIAGEVALLQGKAKIAAQHFASNTQRQPGNWMHQVWLGRALIEASDTSRGAGALRYATTQAPKCVEPWIALATGLLKIHRLAEALDAAMEAVEVAPDCSDALRTLSAAAAAVGNPVLVERAEHSLARVAANQSVPPGGSEISGIVMPDMRPERDLVISHVEINRLQGSGVLLQRFFGLTGDFVTLRSRTSYDGVVEFGGTHYILDVPGMSVEQREARITLLLAPYRIRRILCVPFFAEDFLHGVLAAKITGAPTVVYTMDDQIINATEVPAELAQRLFHAARVRLTISPEMQAAYRAKFDLPFDLLPPVVQNTTLQIANHWTPGDGPTDRCAMVGNVWTAGQFQQIRDFARESGWKIDWFGNARLPHLPQDMAAVEKDGVFCRGFVPEEHLAAELARYPFVLLPSGRLDGTEDNEWLTRLSIPSRVVFIVTQTHTPLLVLGSPETAAARFVLKFNLGLCAGDNGSAKLHAETLSQPETRAAFLMSARSITPAFVMPNAGDWIWRSLAAGHAIPTEIHALWGEPNGSAANKPILAA